MGELPLRGWPDDVVDDLTECINGAINKDEVSEFYIGRSGDLEATSSRHDADEIIALYETNSRDNAIQVEEFLIDIFYEYEKCSNEAPHGGGGTSEEFSSSYVYLALWYK